VLRDNEVSAFVDLASIRTSNGYGVGCAARECRASLKPWGLIVVRFTSTSPRRSRCYSPDLSRGWLLSVWINRFGPLIGYLVWRETQRRTPAVAAASVFLCSTAWSETILDLARVEALSVLLILASLAAARVGQREPLWSLANGATVRSDDAHRANRCRGGGRPLAGRPGVLTPCRCTGDEGLIPAPDSSVGSSAVQPGPRSWSRLGACLATDAASIVLARPRSRGS